MTQCHRIANQKRGCLKPTKSPAQGHLWCLISYPGKTDTWSQLPLGPQWPSTHLAASLDCTAASNLLPPSHRMSSRGQGQLCPWLAELWVLLPDVVKRPEPLAEAFSSYTVCDLLLWVDPPELAALSLRCKTQGGTSREGHLPGRGRKRSQTPTTNILFLHTHDCMKTLFTIARM